MPAIALHWRVLPAYCLATRSVVMLKIASVRGESARSPEIDICELLTSPPHVDNPHNPLPPSTSVKTVLDADGSYLAHLIVMPVLADLDFERFLMKGTCAEVIHRLFSSVAFIHSLGIYHGDMDYSNIVMTPRGPPFQVYIIDFELARRIAPEDVDTFTMFSQGMKFPPPEVDGAPGQPYSPFRADVYGLGFIWGLMDPEGTTPWMRAVRRECSHDDPALRLTARETLIRIERQLRALPWWWLYRPSFSYRWLWMFDRRSLLPKTFAYALQLVPALFRGFRFNWST